MIARASDGSTERGPPPIIQAARFVSRFTWRLLFQLSRDPIGNIDTCQYRYLSIQSPGDANQIDPDRPRRPALPGPCGSDAPCHPSRTGRRTRGLRLRLHLLLRRPAANRLASPSRAPRGRDHRVREAGNLDLLPPRAGGSRSPPGPCLRVERRSSADPRVCPQAAPDVISRKRDFVAGMRPMGSFRPRVPGYACCDDEGCRAVLVMPIVSRLSPGVRSCPPRSRTGELLSR
jgi:hypothetical protein